MENLQKLLEQVRFAELEKIHIYSKTQKAFLHTKTVHSYPSFRKK